VLLSIGRAPADFVYLFLGQETSSAW
jgi:hypothetical protein